MLEQDTCKAADTPVSVIPKAKGKLNLTTLNGQIVSRPQPETQMNLSGLKEIGNVVVLFPGLMEQTSGVFDEFVRVLKERHVPYVVSRLPGMEGSVEDSSRFTVHGAVSHAVRLLKEIKTLSCRDSLGVVIVGHSLGSNLGLFLMNDKLKLPSEGILIREQHLFNPAFKARSWKLNAIDALHRRELQSDGEPVVCRKSVQSMLGLIGDVSLDELGSELKSTAPKGMKDAPFVKQLPDQTACDALQFAAHARNVRIPSSGVTFYESGRDVVVVPRRAPGDDARSYRYFPNASHFLPAEEEGVKAFEGALGKLFPDRNRPSKDSPSRNVQKQE